MKDIFQQKRIEIIVNVKYVTLAKRVTKKQQKGNNVEKIFSEMNWMIVKMKFGWSVKVNKAPLGDSSSTSLPLVSCPYAFTPDAEMNTEGGLFILAMVSHRNLMIEIRYTSEWRRYLVVIVLEWRICSFFEFVHIPSTFSPLKCITASIFFSSNFSTSICPFRGEEWRNGSNT
jgi:hypothetical protein